MPKDSKTQLSHVANLGKMVEEQEIRLRGSLQEVYSERTKVGYLNSAQSCNSELTYLGAARRQRFEIPRWQRSRQAKTEPPTRAHGPSRRQTEEAVAFIVLHLFVRHCDVQSMRETTSIVVSQDTFLNELVRLGFRQCGPFALFAVNCGGMV